MDYRVHDPVCGKSLNWHESLVISYKGTLFYFCCDSCLKIFRHSPRRHSCEFCDSKSDTLG